MWLDNGDLYRFAALRADIIDNECHRHREFLFAPGEHRTLEGVQLSL